MLRTLPSPRTNIAPRTRGWAIAVPRWRPWGLAGLLGLSLLLRLLFLARPGLHPDEALYASWALRIADGSDPALLGVYVDKPPLVLYLLAGLFWLAGAGRGPLPPADTLVMVARLAGVTASVASVGLLYASARQVYPGRVSWLAAALYAVSPLAVRLSPTLFTDPWLVFWMLLGIWAALGRRAWLAGIACGLAYATKQQAVLLVPLVLAAFLFALRRSLSPPPSSSILPSSSLITHRSSLPRSLWRFLNGFLLLFAVVLWWDSLRWQWMPSYWERSLTTYGGVVALPADSLIGRLGSWGELLRFAFGWPLLILALLIGAGLAGRAVLYRRQVVSDDGHRSAGQGAAAWFDGLLLAFVGAYLALHLATTLAPWDRYALPLAPVIALLIARGFWLAFELPPKVWATPGGRAPAAAATRRVTAQACPCPGVGNPWPTAQHLRLHRAAGQVQVRPLRAWRSAFPAAVAASCCQMVNSIHGAEQSPRRLRAVLAALLLAGVLYAAGQAAFGRLPVGDESAYDGVAPVATFVRHTQPPGAVVYHHWLGWHYDFYLYAAPVELRWWATPGDLAKKAAAGQAPRQLIAFPAGRSTGEAIQALAASGLQLTPLLRTFHPDGSPSLTLFRIDPTPAGAQRDGQ